MEVKWKKIMKMGIVVLLLSVLGVGLYFAIQIRRDRNDETVKSDKHTVMLTIKNIYDGPVFPEEDYKVSTYITVYYDGTVEYCEYYNLSGETTTVSWELDDATFGQLVDELEKEFMNHEERDDGFDGSYITVIYYDEKEDIKKQYGGYIYGLEDLINIISSEEMNKVEKKQP